MIVGTGAVGSLLAYAVNQAGHTVTTLGRSPYVRAVEQRGLLVEDRGRAIQVSGIRTAEQVERLGDVEFDLVIITTKAFDTAVAAVQVQPFVQRGARILVLQNGIGGIEIAQTILGDQGLYAGVLTLLVEAPKPAVVSRYGKRGGIGIAPLVPGQDVAWLVEALHSPHLPVRTYADWRSMVWSKLMLDLPANAVPAILDRSLEQIYADRRFCEIERAALVEAWTVVRQMRIRLVNLPGYAVPLLVRAICTLPPALSYPLFRRSFLNARSGKRSLLQADLARGRSRSEVEFLNGAVVRAGERLGVPTPTNRVLNETLTSIARGEVEWIQYQGQGERLARRALAQGMAQTFKREK